MSLLHKHCLTLELTISQREHRTSDRETIESLHLFPTIPKDQRNPSARVRVYKVIGVFVKGFSATAIALSLLAACQGSAAEPVFQHLAEGLTSKNKKVGIMAAQRMFSVPAMGEVCAHLQAPARIVVMGPKPLQLVRGQWFSYRRLVVLAVDSSGKVLPPVPITVEVEGITPPVLNLLSDMTASPDGKVLPIGEGGFRFRFRAICEGHSIATVAWAEVVVP